MPKAMERALERAASKKGLTGKARNAYVYGTMQKAGKLEYSPVHMKKRDNDIGDTY